MDSKQELNLEQEALIDEQYEEFKRNAEEAGLDSDLLEQEAIKKANKIIKKNKRELQRLQKHAEKCLLELNKVGYIYSVGKIRTIIRQPMTDEQLSMMYETSVQSLVEMVKEQLTKKDVDSEK